MNQPDPQAGPIHNFLAQIYGRLFWLISTVGLPPNFIVQLHVQGRRSGRMRSLIVMTATLDGGRYLVSVLGEKAQWVHNVRAAGGEAVIRHGNARRVLLEEVPVDQRAPILKAYLKWALGARPLFDVPAGAPVEDFERIAPKHTVFRILDARYPDRPPTI